MNRTYNVFVDNGLFVIANHLNKTVEEITIDDLKNNTTYFADLFARLFKTDKYKSLAYASFQNSSYTKCTQALSIEDISNKVNIQFTNILNNITKVDTQDICTTCDEIKSINYDDKFISSVSKSLLPRLASNTFFNFSNNFKKQNVCPTCLYLSMLSFFNISSITGNCILFNSDNNEFMYDYTYEHEFELNRDILLNANKYKVDTHNPKTYIGELENLIIKKVNENKLYNGYINIIKFYNSAQDENYDINILNKKDLILLNDLQNKALLDEFKYQKLFYQLLKNNLQKSYLQYVFDFKENKLKISKELFNIIEERYGKMSKNKLELIKKVCKKVNEQISKDMIKEIKAIDKLNQFEKLMNTWIEVIPDLMTLEEYDSLCDFKEFSSIKNRIYVELINLKNEGER